MKNENTPAPVVVDYRGLPPRLQVREIFYRTWTARVEENRPAVVCTVKSSPGVASDVKNMIQIASTEFCFYLAA